MQLRSFPLQTINPLLRRTYLVLKILLMMTLLQANRSQILVTIRMLILLCILPKAYCHETFRKQTAEPSIEHPNCKQAANGVGGNVETPFSPSQRSNVSAVNAHGKGLQQGAANVQDIGLQQGIHNDAMPAEDATVGGEWETMKKKQKNSQHHKKTMASSVGAAGATVSAASGVAGMGANIAPVSGATVRAASGVVGMGSDFALVSGAAASVAGMRSDFAPVSGATTRAASGVVGMRADIAPVSGMADRAARADSLMAARVVSSVAAGADSGLFIFHKSKNFTSDYEIRMPLDRPLGNHYSDPDGQRNRIEIL
ncbi:hypothetical protein OIU85_002360 [Salix viminalis]|uniref:Uncharacterized protein n=1 Tax=Salix viminalis TaxID=40686 RepID=A0A9Q0ZYR8_SALVM|nr:hypothetical protein OIU85_002360 [Salix viminalis]